MNLLKNTWIIGLCLMAIGLTTSCTEEVDFFVPLDVEGTKGDVRSVTVKLDRPPTFHYINGIEGGVIQQEGVIIQIPPASFEDENGNLWDGQVQLNVRTMMSNSEIMRHRISTFANGQVFQSFGVTDIQAYANEGLTKLSLREGKSMEFHIENVEAMEDAELFIGSKIDNDFAWEEADGDPNSTESVWENSWFIPLDGDTITGTGYSFKRDQLGWSGVGAYFDASTTTNFCVELGENFESINTIIYVAFKDYPIVSELFLKDGHIFCPVDVPLPLEQEVNVLVIADIFGQPYMAEIGTVVNESFVIAMAPSLTSINQIRKRIDEL